MMSAAAAAKKFWRFLRKATLPLALILGWATVAILFFGISAVLGAVRGITPVQFVSWCGSLVSTFIGAWVAFSFANVREKKLQDEKEVIAGNLVLSTTMEFLDRQKQYHRDFIGPAKNQPGEPLNLLGGPPLDFVDLKLNRNDLAFILRADAKVWQKLIMEERRFRAVAMMIDTRNTLLLTDVQPRLEVAKVQDGAKLTLKQMENLVGVLAFQKIKQLDAAISDHVEKNILSTKAAFDSARVLLKSMYPREKFIAIQ
jgi:hypothetical protein